MIGFQTSEKYKDNYNNYVQFFLGSPNSYAYYKLSEHITSVNKRIVIHSKFVGNLAKRQSTNLIYNNIKTELLYLQYLNISNSGTIIHLSKFYEDDIHKDMDFVTERLNEICDKLENILDNDFYNYIIIETSDNMNHIGSKTDHFKYIYDKLSSAAKKRIKFCIDTSHIYVTYYNINNERGLFDYLTDFDLKVGLHNVKCIHLNNNGNLPLSSDKKHTPITDNGNIFFKDNTVLSYIKSFSDIYNIPVIIERSTVVPESEIEKIVLKEIEYYKKIDTNNIKYLNCFNKIKIIKQLQLLSDVYEVVDINKSKQLNKAIGEINNYCLELTYNGYIVTNSYSDIINKFTLLNGIGKETADKIYRILYNTFEIQDDLLKLYNKINNFTDVMFIGKTKALELIDLKINNIEELKNHKDKKNILTNLQQMGLEYYDKLTKIPRKFIDDFYQKLRKYDKKIYILGSYIRGNDFSNDIDILLIDDNCNIDNLIKLIEEHYHKDYIMTKGKKKASIIFKNNDNFFFKVDIVCVAVESEYAGVLYFTGSKMFNIYMRNVARLKNFKLNQNGLYNKQGKIVKINSEEAIFNELSLKYIPPFKRNII